MIEFSISLSDILTVVSIGVSIVIGIYSVYQIKKQRLPYLSCEVKSSVFRIEGNKELKAVFIEPLILQVKNVGRGSAIQICFSSDFDNIQIPNLKPGEPHEFKLPTGEEIPEINIEGKFIITYKDVYLNKKFVVYNYSIIIFDGKMELKEISRN